MELLDCGVVLVLSFWGTSIIFSIIIIPVYISTNSKGVLFLCILTNTYCLLSFFKSSPEDMFIDFLERQEGTVKEKKTSMWERNIDWLPPDNELNPPPRYVPRLGIKPTAFWSAGWCSNRLSHPARAIFCLFDDSHPNGCEVISCGFDLHFLDEWWYWAPFHVPVGDLYVYIGKRSI